MKYTNQIIREAVATSHSVTEVMNKIGINIISGGQHAHISRRIRNCGVSSDHFLKQQDRIKNLHVASKLSATSILVKRTSGKRRAALLLRRSLIDIGRDYRCESCGLEKEWNGKLIILEVDHKNNDCLDDRAENIRFLCPNCHSQRLHKMNRGMTDITGTKNIRSISTKKCPSCLLVEIPKSNKTCLKCRPQTLAPNKRFKIDWPSIEVLLEAQKERRISKIALALGVSDTAIRKRIKDYKIASMAKLAAA